RGIHVEDFGLSMLGKIAPEIERFQRLDLVAESCGLLEQQFLAGGTHLVVELFEHNVLLAVQKQTQTADIGAVRLAIDSEAARLRTLVERMEQTRTEPPPARVALLDVERARPEFEDLLQDADRASKAPSARERAVELDPAIERLASEIDPRKVVAGRD